MPATKRFCNLTPLQAVEFVSEISDQGKLSMPPRLAASFAPAQKVRVIVLFPSGESDDADWSRLTAEQFLNGDAPGDAIYDKE